MEQKTLNSEGGRKGEKQGTQAGQTNGSGGRPGPNRGAFAFGSERKWPEHQEDDRTQVSRLTNPPGAHCGPRLGPQAFRLMRLMRLSPPGASPESCKCHRPLPHLVPAPTRLPMHTRRCPGRGRETEKEFYQEDFARKK